MNSPAQNKMDTVSPTTPKLSLSAQDWSIEAHIANEYEKLVGTNLPSFKLQK